MVEGLWWSLPSPRGLISNVVEQLVDGTSVIIRFPLHRPSGFLDALESATLHRCDTRWMRYRVRVEQHMEDRSPARVLYDLLALPSDGGTVPSVRSLLEAERFRYALFIVECADASAWQPWRRFIREYSQRAKSLETGVRPVFCISLEGQAGRLLPPTDVTLVIEQWNGTATRPDMQLYAAHLLSERNENRLVKATRISVVASLAGTDPELAQHLCALDLDALFEPSSALRSFGSSLGWNGEIGADTEQELGARVSLEGEEVLHSALIALRGDKRELARRVWEGQVRELLPFVEVQRVRLIDLAKRYLPNGVVSDGYGTVTAPDDLEIRSIWHFLRKARAPSRLIEQASHLRKVRNALAHLEPLRANELEALARLNLG